MSFPEVTKRQNRHRALAALELEIGRVEKARARCLPAVEGSIAGGADARRARAMLGMADERLGLLRRSRPVLSA